MTNEIATTLKEIELIKKEFQKQFCKALGLIRVSAPLIIDPTTGLNDDLNGIERKVDFTPECLKGTGKKLEIVQSLAKWKRYVIWKYNLCHGIVADMNAIRQDEHIDNLHSLYVDQWDWELPTKLPTEHMLHAIVAMIWVCIRKVDKKLECFRPRLLSENDQVFFISSEELYQRFPHLNSKERENAIAKEKKVVFVSHIGCVMEGTNKRHDLRAPDYDDWKLNGDLIVYSPVLDSSIELSSMGVRVNASSLESQLKELNLWEERHNLPYHQLVLNGSLPQTIGGGIGQSRLCMYLLQKQHIAQVQSSFFPNIDSIDNHL